MNILITYDVNTEDKIGQRRLSHIARICKDYGCRVQNSVFECVVTEVQLIELCNKLEVSMNTMKDSIRIYFINKNHRIITLGQCNTIEVDGELII